MAPLLALVLAAVDPCAPVAPVAPDPQAARAYREVGDAELAAGARDSAVAAYREALARDPGDAASRDALQRLCSDGRAPDPFQDGLRRMDAEDLAGAARAFEAAHAADGSPSAALLAGIARYELGDDAAAERLLRAAERDPVHREEARFYLGLLALRAGDGGRAASLLEGAAANPALASPASDLARLARRDGRVILSLLAESGWDSNVNLGPGGPLGAAESDGTAGLSAAALWRPRGSRGPYLRAAGLLHQLAQMDTYDVAGVEAAAGWQLRAGRTGAAAEYEYAQRTLGGDDYLGAHRLLATGWTRRGRAAASASYAVRFESYAGDWSPFSGVLHRAEARAAVEVTPRLRLSLAYAGARDATDEPVLSYWEHGPRAEARVLLGRARLGVDLGVSWRAYDTFDEDLGAQRSDTYLDGAAFVELDVADRWTARAGVVGRHAASNVDALAYDKLAPSVAIGYTLGL